MSATTATKQSKVDVAIAVTALSRLSNVFIVKVMKERGENKAASIVLDRLSTL